MKNRQEEAISAFDQAAYDKSSAAFKNVWDQTSNLFAKDYPQDPSLDEKFRDFSSKIQAVNEAVSKFREEIREMPVALAVLRWMRALMADAFWFQRYFSKMVRLLERQILSYKDKNGWLTLDCLMRVGHQEILENIRCAHDLPWLEREDMVESYVRFSQSLSNETRGIVPPGYDPDRERVRNKAIRYEVFADFVQHLSERDELIAKLLYFGAPSIDSVLSLKRSSVQEHGIQFEEGFVKFPRHLLAGLKGFLKDKPSSQKLVFVNVRGAEVDRAHLNQSFARACEHMKKITKVTPGSLLKLEGEALEDTGLVLTQTYRYTARGVEVLPGKSPPKRQQK